MSLLRYLLLLVIVVGWCTSQDSADFLRLALEGVAQRQDRLLQKFDEQERKIELQMQEQERKIELQLQESHKTLEENVRLQVEKIQSEVDAFKNTFLTEQEEQRRSLQQCSTKDQIIIFQDMIVADECEQGRSNCSASATCEDAFGHYKCICRPGYSGDGITCEDIDECKTENKICGEGSTCINHPGTYGCLCHEGFREVNHFCTDVDECRERNNVCSDEQVCVNLPGNYSCNCYEGYAKQGDTCQDVDECRERNNVCSDEQVCINVPGSYSCNCYEGYTKEGDTCQDVDECRERNNVCSDEQVCINLPGNYSCNCYEGYAKQGDTCQDINECDSGVHWCHSNATCSNTLGSYTCQCLPYYYGDGYTYCIDCQAEFNKTKEVLIDMIHNNGENLTSMTEEMLREFLEQKESQCQRKGIVSNCKELLDNGEIRSGLYIISPEGFSEGVVVYCDQVTSGGGWTVILRRKRQIHQVDFVKNFEDYATGFGDPNGEFWIGNRLLHSMTGYEPFTLRVDAVNLEGESRTGIWDTFSVGSENTQFTLSVSGYSSSSSTLGDGLWKPYRKGGSANGMKFSTLDRDNDKSTLHCSGGYGKGGWWFNSCYGTAPMAPLGNTNSHSKANWYYWEPTSIGSYIAISEIQFKIRP